jgi:X-X-X-Leu-X-X-Gly heptad repeat protein
MLGASQSSGAGRQTAPLPAGPSGGNLRVTESCRRCQQDPNPCPTARRRRPCPATHCPAGFYTLVTGRITDGSAKLKDGAGQASAGAQQLKEGAGVLASGASRADTGAGKRSAGAEKICAGISEKRAPGADKLPNGAGELTAGAVKIETDVHIKPAPGVYKVDDGAQKLAAGAVQLSAALAPAAAGIAENYLADGAIALHGGAAQLADGTGQLADGTVQLRGHRGANNDPKRERARRPWCRRSSCCRQRLRTPGKGWFRARIAEGTGTCLRAPPPSRPPAWSESRTRPRPWDSWGPGTGLRGWPLLAQHEERTRGGCLGQQFQQGADLESEETRGRLPAAVKPDAQQARRH